jgi:bacterial/archaeal transporter family-2 protein
VDRWLPVAATCLAGGLIALQAPINAVLARTAGSLPAATINFLCGTVALLALVVLIGQAGGIADGTDVPWYYFVGGGALGAIYVTTTLITVRSLGAGGVTAAIVAGQLTASVTADRLGILGLEERALNAPRLAGVLLLVAGTLLVVRA